MNANRDFIHTPDAVVASDGVPHYGVFDAPFRRINLNDARVRSGPVPWPAARNPSPRKAGPHFWIGSEQVFFGLAVIDAKYMKASFASVVDRERGRFVERSVRPPNAQIAIPETLWDDVGYYRAKGYRVAFRNLLEEGRHEVVVEIERSRNCPRIYGRVVLHADLSERPPLVAVLPLGDNRAMYSHKAVLPVEGQLDVGNKTFKFDPGDTRCIIDVHKAHYPYRMWWHWSTMWGWDSDGNEVGLNLTDNVALDAERVNECAVWYQGMLHRLGRASITHPEGEYLQTWNVGTRDGAVRLRFEPEGERSEQINLAAVVSAFHQPYGTFTGEIDLPDGRTIEVVKGWGVCEDHRARW